MSTQSRLPNGLRFTRAATRLSRNLFLKVTTFALSPPPRRGVGCKRGLGGQRNGVDHRASSADRSRRRCSPRRLDRGANADQILVECRAVQKTAIRNHRVDPADIRNVLQWIRV